MVGDEADRRDHDRARTGRGERGQVVVDVRLQPGHRRRPGPGLPDHVELGARPADRLRHQPGRLPQLRGVEVPARAAGGLHRQRDRVRGEHQPRVRPADQRRPHPVRGRLDEPGMVEVVPQLVQLRRPVPDRCPGPGQVVLVLPAPRVRRVGARHEHQRAPHPVAPHGRDRVLDQRVPVAVAPVDRQVELGPDRRQQRPVLRVDRRHPAEVGVVLGHLEQPLPRHAPPADDVLQERQHVVLALRTAEGQQQQCVVLGAHAVMSTRPSRGTRRRRARSRRSPRASSPTAARRRSGRPAPGR